MTKNKATVGVFAIARNTFDVPFAESKLKEAMTTLNKLNLTLKGGDKLLFSETEANEALADIKKENVDAILILQASFADASITVKIAEELNKPIILWSFPEDRIGGRLRLNSFCGINLASHALSRVHKQSFWIHGNFFDNQLIKKFEDILSAARTKQALYGSKIMVIGDYPLGFDTCNYDVEVLRNVFGVSVEKATMENFFTKVANISDDEAEKVYEKRKELLLGLEAMDKTATHKTIKTYLAIKDMLHSQKVAGVAVRCWPEFFTMLGGAACGALGMIGEEFIPGGCEADVYGVLTSRVLSLLSNDVVFNTDLVDVNFQDNSCVFWHCGQAPIQMKEPTYKAEAALHSNRKMPLLSQFPLKAGKITVARISQSYNKMKVLLAEGEMLKRDISYTGTSGVARFNINMEDFIANYMEAGAEHHVSLVYGNHKEKIKHWAKMLNIEVNDIGNIKN